MTDLPSYEEVKAEEKAEEWRARAEKAEAALREAREEIARLKGGHDAAKG